MAVLLSDEYKKSYKLDQKDKLVGVFETPDARKLTAEMKVMTLELSVAAALAGTEIVLLGKAIKGIRIRQIQVFADVSAAMTVGLYAPAADQDLAATPAAVVAFTSLTPAAGGVEGAMLPVDFELPSDHLIGFVGAAGCVSVKVVVLYSEM